MDDEQEATSSVLCLQDAQSFGEMSEEGKINNAQVSASASGGECSQGVSDVLSVSQPKCHIKETNYDASQVKSVSSGLAKGDSAHSKHRMATRSKTKSQKSTSDVRPKDSISQQSRSYKRRGSCLSSRSKTSSSCFSRLSLSQREAILKSKSQSQQQKMALEKEQLQKRLQIEEKMLLCQRQHEEEEVERSHKEFMRKQEQEFELHQEELRRKRQREEENFRLQRQRDIDEFDYRSKKEQLELEAELNETIAEKRLTTNSLASVPILPQNKFTPNVSISVVNHGNPQQSLTSFPETTPNVMSHASNVIFSTPPELANISTLTSGGSPPPASSQGMQVNSILPQIFGKTTSIVPTFTTCVTTATDSVRNVIASACETEPVILKSNHACNSLVVNSNPMHAPTTSTDQTSPAPMHVSQPACQIIQVPQPLSVPPLAPPTFSGDASDYLDFINDFNATIGKSVKDDDQKLQYLIQYTKGAARILVQSCKHKEKCFEAALQLLKENYGQNFQVARACVNSISNGPQLTEFDKEALTMFSAQLTACVETLISINYLHKMDNMDTIEKMAIRMPRQWKYGWRTVVDNVLHEQKLDLSITHLVQYVRKKTREIINMPLSEGTNHGRQFPSQTKNIKPTKSVFTTQVYEKRIQKCLQCDENHYLNQCPSFRGLSYEQRVELVKQHNLCFSCLGRGHIAKFCKRTSPCMRHNCKGKHTTLLHPPDNVYGDTKSQTIAAKTETRQNATQTEDISDMKVNTYLSVASNGMLLQVIPVKIRTKGNKYPIATRALLDSGSTCSFISESLMNKLGVSGPEIDICVNTINGIGERKQTMMVKDLELSDYQESEFVPLNPLLSIPEIPVEKSEIPTQKDVERFPEFENVVIPQIETEIDLIIGMDNVKLHKPLDVIHGPKDYFATRTAAGWMIGCPKMSKVSKFNNFFIKADAHPLCKMCTDVIDSIQNEKEEYSPNQKLFLDKVNQSIKLTDDGHYEINLPLKNDEMQLPLNKVQAEQRVSCLKRRFLRDNKFYSEYKAFVQDMIDNGYAERVTEPSGPSGRTWYLNHHGVYHPEKKTIRIVFDCSAKYHGISLNDSLLQGPDLTNSLVGVLSRFRKEEIAIQGDIRAMFHQVKVAESDRDLFRFLWWKDGDINQPLQEYRMTVYLFGTVCSPSCANFALRKTADDNITYFNPDVTNAVHDSFYVDDFLDSKPTVNQAIAHVRNVQNLVAKGGFEIAKWASNSREVLASIPESDRAKEVKRLDLANDELPAERALGLIWNVEDDTLGFRIRNKEKPATRRGMLSIINSIFDPLGIGQPVVQPAKVLMQNLCKRNYNWDDEIPQDIYNEWIKWCENLTTLKDFSIPRCFKPPDFGKIKEIQIHHFSDASEKSYGAVSYIRLINSSDQIHCSILCGKTGLIPLNPLTIPRLELCAATISARTDKTFRKELKIPISKSYFWTDSTTVLRYLVNKDKVFKTFVENRIGAIKECTDVNQWKYVPSKLNPADVASRGLSVDSFLKCNIWKFGPEFLWKSQDEWPDQPEFLQDVQVDDPEVKQKPKQCLTTSITEPAFMDRAVTKYSSWIKLKKTVAWVLRYRGNLELKSKSQHAAQKTKQTPIQPLSVDEFARAEIEIFKHEQRKYYGSEIEILVMNGQLKKSSALNKLHPILSGRIDAAPLSYESKHPVIIPRESPIAELVIKHIHQKVGHCGREYVLAEMREHYWIVKANSMVRKVINTCFSCRKRQRRTETQQMANLPEDRLTPDKPPFTFVAVDCFGPFMVRQGRSDVKRYGVLFHCLTTRAVHIEIAHSLDTSSFIMALRRFTARRGQVSEIRSDNGTNFVSGERELRESIAHWNQNQIHSFLLQKNIKWIFQTSSASHHGGVFERQIRTIRKILNALCKEQVLKDENLRSLMCECEATMNGRPITTVSDDPNDLKPLTPNSLLLLKQEPVLPPGLFNQKDVYSRKRWKQVQYLADVFWKRWRREYLPLLQNRQKWNKMQRNITKGDIVLIVDENAPRNTWLLGRIVNTFPDKNGMVRSATVQTQHSILDRPITKLILLHACTPD